MAVTDPREHHDDLIEWHVEEAVDAETFEEHRAMEAYRTGWVAIGIVFDDADRLLLAYDEYDEQWVAPGGTLEPGETLADGLRREVREETGVEVVADEPVAVGDVVTRNGDADGEETTEFSVVFLSATAESTDIGDDLGVDDEEITDAGWFEELPEELYDRGGTAEALERCERW
jgi:ADP-ribose pyrophosphatase YjhB (NUDIX family)